MPIFLLCIYIYIYIAHCTACIVQVAVFLIGITLTTTFVFDCLLVVTLKSKLVPLHCLLTTK